MKFKLFYQAFPYDEKGIKQRVIGHVIIEKHIPTHQVLTQNELAELALIKIRETTPSLKNTPVEFTSFELIESEAA